MNSCDIDEVKHSAREQFLAQYKDIEWTFYGTNGYSGDWCICGDGQLQLGYEPLSKEGDTSDPIYIAVQEIRANEELRVKEDRCRRLMKTLAENKKPSGVAILEESPRPWWRFWK